MKNISVNTMAAEDNIKKWFFCNKTAPSASLRIFCFPFSGGGASIYRSWSAAMGDNIEVLALQLPGRESRYNEARELKLSDLVKKIVKAIKLYQDKPFVFFGYSLGALLAFEVIRELRKQSLTIPTHLFVAAMQAPHTKRVHPPFSHLPDNEFIKKIEEYYQPTDVAWFNEELREILLPILKDDMALADSYFYQAEEPLSCSIDVFAGIDDHGAPLALTQLWSEQTSKTITHHVFNGGHFFINSALDEVQAIVLDRLKEKV